MASQPWKQARDVIQARDARIIIIISVHQLQDHAAGSSVHARVNLTVSVGGPGVLTVTIVTTRTHTYSLALSVTAALHSAIHRERERERETAAYIDCQRDHHSFCLQPSQQTSVVFPPLHKPQRYTVFSAPGVNCNDIL